jgi:SAM-dependent MidA family methyltransferase
MTPLEKILIGQIDRFGPLTVADYMTLCLLHPRHGYYMTRDPLGAQGDFTTAPEISQMFGEMLGLLLVQSWQDQGCPARFILAEPGPGRGTLMADILRVGAKMPGFLEAAEICLVEASPALRQVQQATLTGYVINWVDQVSDLPQGPLYLVANEFFDALPIRQFRRSDTGWQEQLIASLDGKLGFTLGPDMPLETLEDGITGAKPGDIVETNAPAQAIMAEIANRLAAFGGIALIVDYGGMGGLCDSFQAVRAHQKVDPFDAPGTADLTAHVDFAALIRAASDLATTGLTDQGVLLERLGITARAQSLAAGLQGAALEAHISAHRRLTHPDEMGSLFKAIAFHPRGTPAPAGFDLYDPGNSDR